MDTNGSHLGIVDTRVKGEQPLWDQERALWTLLVVNVIGCQ